MDHLGLHNPTGLNTARRVLAGCGTQTAGLAFGGYTPPTNTSATEEYDGNSWATSPGSLNTARRDLAGAGIQTAALAFGGYSTAATAATEEYDGSTWTTGGNLGTARYQLAGAGTQTAALGFGGTPTTGATEEWTGAGSPLTVTITAS
jgi:hypothetical protein